MKKGWKKPVLKVLMRSDSQEAVLSNCKAYLQDSPGPEGSQSCLNTPSEGGVEPYCYMNVSS